MSCFFFSLLVLMLCGTATYRWAARNYFFYGFWVFFIRKTVIFIKLITNYYSFLSKIAENDCNVMGQPWSNHWPLWNWIFAQIHNAQKCLYLNRVCLWSNLMQFCIWFTFQLFLYIISFLNWKIPKKFLNWCFIFFLRFFGTIHRKLLLN